jgi:hypothetical protein
MVEDRVEDVAHAWWPEAEEIEEGVVLIPPSKTCPQ